MDRRAFLGAAAGAGLAAVASGSVPVVRRRETLGVAVLGTHSRGGELARQFASIPGCVVRVICDPDDAAIAKGVAKVEEAGGARPDGIRDFRRALDREDVDAVVIATPDHWHAPASLLALSAGKHVYVEKPCGHNAREGELLVLAQARHPGLVVTMGNQRRSSAAVREAVQRLREGVIGRVYHAEAWYANTRGSIGRGKPVAVPSTLDWDLWQGPAPRVAYHDNIVHYNWHWFWNWGTGEACNNACHELDVCRWALGLDQPTRVSSTAQRHRFDDDWEAWDIQQIGLEYSAGRSIVWSGDSVNGIARHGRGRGSLIYGEGGHMLIDAGSYVARADDKSELARWDGDSSGGDATDTTAPTRDLTRVHCEGFLSAIRGEGANPSPIDEGHVSVLMCHLGNIAQRVGRSLTIDPATGHIVGDSAAQSLWGRTYEPGWMPSV